MCTVRLAHLSDVHISASPLGWSWQDWFTKRVTGWVNTFCLSRRWRFRDAAARLALLADDLRARRPDCIVFSGDASMLGFPAEIDRAARILGVTASDMPPGLAVPGNHDYYIPSADRSGAFERSFAPWLTGERIDGATYPFARQIGPVFLIGVNAAVGNVWPSDAGGEVGAAQLERLKQLLMALPPAPRILVTHYPVARQNGHAEKPSHSLRDIAALVDVARQGGVRMWLHGHRHHWYVHRASSTIAPFPTICAGSATEAGLAGYNEYTIQDTQLDILRRSFDAAYNSFRDAERMSMNLEELAQ
jgi:3',5'-cyclic AMP phosphodiesterase CpdA